MPADFASFVPPKRILMGPGPSDVHPRVLDPRTWQQAPGGAPRRAPRGLRAEEAALLSILRPLRTASRTPRLRRPTSSPSQRASAATP